MSLSLNSRIYRPLISDLLMMNLLSNMRPLLREFFFLLTITRAKNSELRSFSSDTTQSSRTFDIKAMCNVSLEIVFMLLR